MLIDFQPVLSKEKTLLDLANQYSRADLATALNSYVDTTCQMMRDLDNEAYVRYQQSNL